MASFFIPEKFFLAHEPRTNTVSGKISFLHAEQFDESMTTYINSPFNGATFNKNIDTFSSFTNKNKNIFIHHPEGFDFEISQSNFIEILNHTDVQNKSLIGDFVFAFEGNKTILLPLAFPLYESISNTSTNNKHFTLTSKNLIIGATYCNNDSDKYIYLGFHKMNYLQSSFNEDDTRYHSGLTHTRSYKSDKFHIVEENIRQHIFVSEHTKVIQSFSKNAFKYCTNNKPVDVSEYLQAIHAHNSLEILPIFEFEKSSVAQVVDNIMLLFKNLQNEDNLHLSVNHILKQAITKTFTTYFLKNFNSPEDFHAPTLDISHNNLNKMQNIFVFSNEIFNFTKNSNTWTRFYSSYHTLTQCDFSLTSSIHPDKDLSQQPINPENINLNTLNHSEIKQILINFFTSYICDDDIFRIKIIQSNLFDGYLSLSLNSFTYHDVNFALDKMDNCFVKYQFKNPINFT